MNDCKKYIELISACIDGEISDADRSELEIHLEFCPECRKVAEAFAAINSSFPREEAVPENFTSGTMAKIKAEAAKPTGIKKFISGYGKYTGLAAALVVILLGAQVFNGGGAKESAAPGAAYMNSTAMTTMTAADTAAGEPMAVPETEMATNDSIDFADFDAVESKEYVTEDGISAVPGGSARDDSEPAPAPEAAESPAESQFSVTVQVTDVNELYKLRGYKERFYSVSRLNEPAPEEFSQLLASDEVTQIFKSLDEIHFRVPMTLLNELNPEVFTEIVFDDLTAQYGLVILMTAEE